MDLELKDKVALVTGASKGLGRSIALRLAQEGMHVAILARNESQLRSLAAQIESGGRRCLVYPADLTAEGVPQNFVAAAFTHFGRLDLLVNNAGATKRGDFLTLPESDWADGFALKFFGAVKLCRAAWPHLVASHGSIVNIAGVGGRTGSAEFTIGGAVNAALSISPKASPTAASTTACASTPSTPAPFAPTASTSASPASPRLKASPPQPRPSK